MRLLVTRPEPDAGATAAALEARGHVVHCHPLMRIVYEPEPALAATPGAIAVTSGNGVRALARWRQAAGWRALPLFAVGQATAETAADLGFADVRRADGDVAALARLIANRWPADAGAVLYSAARERSAELGAPLEAAGIAVRTVVAYRTEAVAGAAVAVGALLAAGAVDGAVVTSRRAAGALAVAAGPAGLAGVTVFALSQNAAEPLAGLAGSLKVAERPDMESLYAVIG